MPLTASIIRRILKEAEEMNSSGEYNDPVRIYFSDMRLLADFIQNPILDPNTEVCISDSKPQSLPKKYFEVVCDNDLYRIHAGGFEDISSEDGFTHRIKNPINVRKYIESINAKLGHIGDDSMKDRMNAVKSKYEEILNISFNII